MEKGKSGCNMFKYKLVRIPGQTSPFATWKLIQKWKGVSSRVGLILPDLTSGAESTPVSLVNEVDDEKGPAYFTYFPTVKYLKSFNLVQSAFCCDCHRGWGLWSWDPIRTGAFICEYAGEVVEIDEYSFDTNRHYESFKWNYEPELVGEESSDASEDFDIPSPLSISTKNTGNVARFMNHSCTPNIFWQPIMYEHNNESDLRIGFFTKKHIPPMTEFKYDYGTLQSNETESYRPVDKQKRTPDNKWNHA
ncbi:Histone-lysine N-methyltransferase, H3 lysine-9 specific SUVH1 [Hibiscus syriacus]|uniref:Histone-lysine N-methyltransferase, H3 lysine-9 specific SUVH1 n=1 Tax=Hibiscus syriacus TaxID=106335 RepID=A0A6A3AXD2_HIBSY|nr:Histone-lysine N-methyltransferase, H3 lysine-9 specific SUVH1 [Hibiscus syriacus]